MDCERTSSQCGMAEDIQVSCHVLLSTPSGTPSYPLPPLTVLTYPHQSSPPHPGLPQLPPETYHYLVHALLSLQRSAPNPYPLNHPSASSVPSPDYGYSWQPDTLPLALAHPLAGQASFHPTDLSILLPHLTAPPSIGSSQLTSSPTTVSPAQEQDDAVSVTEDKRRRNTVASARFRIKKKLKTLNLERSVADLTGRTEELEREATDLRRENAWLKEIVLLKGRNLSGLNFAQAPAPGYQPHEDQDDDCALTGSRPESTTQRRGKGKDKNN